MSGVVAALWREITRGGFAAESISIPFTNPLTMTLIAARLRRTYGRRYTVTTAKTGEIHEIRMEKRCDE